MPVLPYNIRELEAFRALLLEGSTTAAAKRCGVSQSSISRSVARLEEKVHTVLFDRSGGRAIPTQEALKLDRYLDDIFDPLKDIESSNWLLDQPKILYISATSAFARALLKPVIISFSQIHPDIKITVDVNRAKDVIKSVEQGDCELGILWKSNLSGQRLAIEEFRSARAHVIVPKDHPLASKSVVHPEDLDGYELIGDGQRSVLWRKLMKIFETRGMSPKWVLNFSNLDIVLDSVLHGAGIGVVPAFPMDPGQYDKLVAIEFEPKLDKFAAITYRIDKPLPVLAEEFKNHLIRVTKDYPYSEPVHEPGENSVA